MKKKTKIIIVTAIVLLIVFLVLVLPYIKFKSIEKSVLESTKRYYEINNSHLPTGNKIKEVDLKTLYVKDFIDADLKTEITDRKCNLENSWVKVQKVDNEYKYYTYLECGIFKSSIDYKGPTINLNGKDEIILYKDEKYKELGIKSVVDNKDGKIDIKKVSIDSSKVNSSKIGTYEVTYKVKDSFNNETIKIRKVVVTETLNHIVTKNTDKTKVYKGSNHYNYLKLDGILFKIVGINNDGTVKIVSNEGLGAVNYDDVDTWLNDYFYEKFSDSAKKYIKEDSKWCNDKVTDIKKVSKCKSTTKEQPVGLLSIQDFNNSKDGSGVYNVEKVTLLYNTKDNKNIWYFDSATYKSANKEENIIVSPALNIIKDAKIISGDGSLDNPYILKGNKKKLEAGNKISDARTGEYLSYSGYNFRVISKESDGTTKIIMNDIVKSDSISKYFKFDSGKVTFDISKKGNIGYILANEVSNYVKTSLFVNKENSYYKYKSIIGYKNEKSATKYKLKINLPSMYDLYSTSLNDDFWYKEYSNDKYCYMLYTGIAECKNYDFNNIKGIRVVAYLNKNVTIEKGKGTITEPYVIVG